MGYSPTRYHESKGSEILEKKEEVKDDRHTTVQTSIPEASKGVFLLLIGLGVFGYFRLATLSARHCEVLESSLEKESVGAESVFWYAYLTALSTGLGVTPFLFSRSLQPWVLGCSNAMAAGMMLAASLRLGIEGASTMGHGDHEKISSNVTSISQFFTYWLRAEFVSAEGFSRLSVGLLIGIVSIYYSKQVLDAHEGIRVMGFRGLDAKKIMLIMGVMTLHSATEGIGIGVSFATHQPSPGGGESTHDSDLARCKGASRFGQFVSTTMAVHNIPEGLATCLILVPRGAPLIEAFLWAVFTSIPQPIFAPLAYISVSRFAALQPIGLGFAAGAMGYVATLELLPEAIAEIGRPLTSVVALFMFCAMYGFQLWIQTAGG
jgi:zinc transporter ZupT